MLPESRSYEEMYRQFRWQVPGAVQYRRRGLRPLGRARPGQARARRRVARTAASQDVSYGWLRETSNRLANALAAHGIKRGDRVAILLPQAPEVAAIHIAIYKLGAIALPLATLFGPDALAYRLQNAGAKALLTDAQGLAKIAEIRRANGDALAGLELILSVDGPGDGALGFAETLARASADFTPVATAADDPAMMIYTSGTTGQPKGALHAHRVLIGHMPGIELPQEFFPQPGDRFWTPADWAWAGGLLDCLLPSLYCGVPVVARRFDKFDPEEAFAVMARFGVRNAFIPPTALRMLRAVPNPRGRHDIALRSVGSGGEALGAETFEWGKAALGVVDQRVLRPDRMQSRGRLLRVDRRGRGRARSARRSPATPSR